MPYKIVAAAKSQVLGVEFDSLPIEPDQVRLKSRTSLISPGTEGIILHGLYEPGSHYDNFVKHPYHLGYSLVGEVTEIGPEVTGWQLGDRAFARRGHATEVRSRIQDMFRVPANVPDEVAQWAALAMVGSMVLNAGDIRLQDDVLIVGAGPIGQMALRWCVAAGCRVAIIDTMEPRLEIAKLGGAFAVKNGTAADAKTFAIEAFGKQPRIAIDTTGIPAVFQQCLEIPRNHGTLVLLGDTGKPSEQRLSFDIVIRGIKIHGAHISHETDEWFEAGVYEKFCELYATGRFSMDGMNTHRMLPSKCVEAYDVLITQKAQTMGVWFDWRESL